MAPGLLEASPGHLHAWEGNEPRACLLKLWQGKLMSCGRLPGPGTKRWAEAISNSRRLLRPLGSSLPQPRSLLGPGALHE